MPLYGFKKNNHCKSILSRRSCKRRKGVKIIRMNESLKRYLLFVKALFMVSKTFFVPLRLFLLLLCVKKITTFICRMPQFAELPTQPYFLILQIFALFALKKADYTRKPLISFLSKCCLTMISNFSNSTRFSNKNSSAN